jgi:hypothetical protein
MAFVFFMAIKHAKNKHFGIEATCHMSDCVPLMLMVLFMMERGILKDEMVWSYERPFGTKQ